MKLSKLYSNTPAVFGPIHFHSGLNVVLGSVHRPKNRERDTHNLGKTLLAQVIDFCLLRQKTQDFFLIKHAQFASFVFFLEVELFDGTYITVRRSVADASRASFIRHTERAADHTLTPEGDWLHWNVPFERSKQLLDAALDLTAVHPWSFRNAVSYALRTQRDYDEPFKLAKFAGRHADWKPFLAHLLGFDGDLVAQSYSVEDQIESLSHQETQARSRAAGVDSPDQLKGLLEIAERDVQGLAAEVEGFTLAPIDKRLTRELVDDIDEQLGQANEERYLLQSDRQRVLHALEHRMGMDLDSLSALFAQAKIYFGEQVRKDYSALERFNRELVEERDTYLRRELEVIDAKLADVEDRVASLNVRRTGALKALSNAEAFAAYKRLTTRLAARQGELEAVKTRLEAVDLLQTIRRQVRALRSEREVIHERLDDMVKSGSPKYTEIRRIFDDVLFTVLGSHGNLFTTVNSEGHVEFGAQIIDAEGNATSAGEGFSYGRLMCIAFDLALLRAYSAEHYPRFVYHDGALETLDDRKKLNLIDLMRVYGALGTQHIVTAIDSELPMTATGTRFQFAANEIILHLHDADESGRLFRMPPW